MSEAFLTLDLPDEAATAALAEDVAVCLAAGDVVALCGGLGVGKTVFARALVRALAGDPGLEVPSPTFTLVQSYRAGDIAVAHVDLYRLSDAAELDELGLADVLADGIVLVEWPERAGDRLPRDRLTIDLAILEEGRRASLSGPPGWQARLARSRTARDFLARAGFAGARRHRIHGDASPRRYERIATAGGTAVLMDWPKDAAAPFRDRRARYRASEARAYVAVAGALAAAGFSAPEIYAADAAAGFVLMEDFGSEGIVAGDTPIAQRYRATIAVLAAIHAQPRPPTLAVAGDGRHRLPALTGEVVAADLDLFVDWYVPHVTSAPLAAAGRRQFAALWSGLSQHLAAAEQSWVLFDMQSANLFWLADRAGVKRIGLIDFQDMFVGPAAYDVASLCQDARVTVPAALEADLRAHYVSLRQSAAPAFDSAAFSSAYAIAAAARALKNLGVFARQADHLGRPGYLRHVPRVGEYLVRNFSHPVLSELAVWYERHLPAAHWAPR